RPRARPRVDTSIKRHTPQGEATIDKPFFIERIVYSPAPSKGQMVVCSVPGDTIRLFGSRGFEWNYGSKLLENGAGALMRAVIFPARGNPEWPCLACGASAWPLEGHSYLIRFRYRLNVVSGSVSLGAMAKARVRFSG